MILFSSLVLCSEGEDTGEHSEALADGGVTGWKEAEFLNQKVEKHSPNSLLDSEMNEG